MNDQFAQIFSAPRGEPKDITEDEEYQKFVESMVPHCHCAGQHRPCDGVLAGGLCDNIQDDGPTGCDCPECGGSGRDEDSATCNHCGGDGHA